MTRKLPASCRAAFALFLLVVTAAVAADHVDDSPKPVPSPLARQLDQILLAARVRHPDVIVDFSDWRASQDPDAVAAVLADADRPAAQRELLDQLIRLTDLAEDARDYALTALGNPDFDETIFPDLLRDILDSHPAADLSLDAVRIIADYWRAAVALGLARDQVLRRFQSESRDGEISIGTRLAWHLIRVGAADPETAIDPVDFHYDDTAAELKLIHHGADIAIRLEKDDYKTRTRATVDGFRFRTGWTVLLQKPLSWMAEMAAQMRDAGLVPDEIEWELWEGPHGLVALADNVDGDGNRIAPRRLFYNGAIHDVSELPLPTDARQAAEDFLAAAETLHHGIMADDRIPLPLRQALHPILMGAYKPIDTRDYFDNAFCRRLIEADYLEAHIVPLPPERAAELTAYRQALAKIEAGFDRFAAILDDGSRLVAVTRPDIDAMGASGDPVDPETGETLPPYTWRRERGDATAFHSPLPGRYLYSLSLVETYSGVHHARPSGAPDVTEVWHPIVGLVGRYEKGDAAATGDPEAWLEAVVMDARGRRDPSAGPLGWNFPMHILVRDDQGDPVALATPAGVVPSPDFSGQTDPAACRDAQDAWLDAAAGILQTPGELALIFQHFFRYCSDSPLPELPNLIGSHYGLSDTHQTVYQSLERRWVGRLIGDCDDLAEFFQVLLTRQGRLAHVMQLPAHAAAGSLAKVDDDTWQFIVLQTGPVLQFNALTPEAAVEKAYRSFDADGGSSHFTVAAVPLLLRFADEDTRTPFVLSARIYWDREYAEAMVRVQKYWHLHVYSAAVTIMEDMLGRDRDVANIKELASLYERVGEYERSDALRREEYEAANGDGQAALSALLDIAQLHVQDKNKPRALEALTLAEQEMTRMWESAERDAFERAAGFRAYWAGLLAREDEPERAWALVQRDVQNVDKRGGRYPDYLVRTLLTLYDRIALKRTAGRGFDPDVAAALEETLDKAFRRNYFKHDDSYNRIMGRYYWLGRYAASAFGRDEGLARLLADGPYPTAAQDPEAYAAKTSFFADEEWAWLRINPRLYLSLALEMIDQDDHPDLYDPAGARPILEAVVRAAERGAALGADSSGRDAVVKARLLLAFLNRDLDEYARVMTEVRDKDYSSLYDDAAVLFGSYCGLVPAAEFLPWVEAYHRFFPGRQHYFKAAYRALDKEHYDHAAMLGRASAGFFPDDELLVREAAALEKTVERLKERSRRRSWREKDWAVGEAAPAA